MTDTLDREIVLADIPAARDLVPTDRRLLPAPMAQLEEGADLIQKAGGFVSADVRNDRGACVALAYMSALHGTDLIATASKAYLVPGKGGQPGRLAFEAQYISALVRQHIDEPFDITFHGTGGQRFARVVGKVKGKVLDYTSPQLSQIKTKNSPSWFVDPDQQLGAYYSVRAWARRHMPDVLLGIYAVEELQQISIRDVTPPKPADLDGDAPEPEDAAFEEATQEAPFEPSGGFTTATEERESEPPPPAADDILAWAEECKTDAREAASPAELQQLWDACEANRRKLWKTERHAHDELETVFKDRLADLQ